LPGTPLVARRAAMASTTDEDEGNDQGENDAVDMNGPKRAVPSFTV
jgi:hypothetical protein